MSSLMASKVSSNTLGPNVWEFVYSIWSDLLKNIGSSPGLGDLGGLTSLLSLFFCLFCENVEIPDDFHGFGICCCWYKGETPVE